MGRRSINTTKSGKYMNPTDQARKEARKRELKKNKKQRQMVRAAVLKGKDPLQLIRDMENIDEMEYNVNAPPLLNEKVLKDKRKKLKETWDRVMRLYYKEDRERYNELKKLELEYEARRSILVKFYESVRIAQQVQVDEIPLPDAPEMPLFLTSQIPLPSEMENIPDLESLMLPHSILKKTSFFNTSQPEPIVKNVRAPGVPPGPIPELSSDEEDEIDESTEAANADSKLAKSRKIRFADEKEADSDDEEENQKEERELENMDVSENLILDSITDKQKLDEIPVPPMPSSLPPGPPPRLPQGPPPSVQVMFRPPPIRTAIPPPPRMLPPGVPPPPPGRPTLPPPGIPIRLGAPPIRLPPGPPPGMPPPRLIRPPTAPPPRLPTVSSTSSMVPPGTTLASGTTPATAAGNITVLSAPPSLMQRPKIMPVEEEAQRSATIEAKPQIRNLSADVMRFMPTTLRVKREDRHKKSSSKTGVTFDHTKDNYPSAAPMSNPAVSAPTKDDAYQQFLREMEELL